MTDRSLIKLIALALIVLTIVVIVEVREQRQYRMESAATLLQLEARLETIDADLTEMQVTIDGLQKNSVKAVVERANDAVVDGFSSMMGTLTRELGSLSELMQEQLEEGAKQAEPQEKDTSPDQSSGATVD